MLLNDRAEQCCIKVLLVGPVWTPWVTSHWLGMQALIWKLDNATWHFCTLQLVVHTDMGALCTSNRSIFCFEGKSYHQWHRYQTSAEWPAPKLCCWEHSSSCPLFSAAFFILCALVIHAAHKSHTLTSILLWRVMAERKRTVIKSHFIAMNENVRSCDVCKKAVRVCVKTANLLKHIARSHEKENKQEENVSVSRSPTQRQSSVSGVISERLSQNIQTHSSKSDVVKTDIRHWFMSHLQTSLDLTLKQ